MGNKVKSIGMRPSKVKPHLGEQSLSSDTKDYVIFCSKTLPIRGLLKKECGHRAGIAVCIERPHKELPRYDPHSATRCDHRPERSEHSKVCARKSPRSLNLTCTSTR